MTTDTYYEFKYKKNKYKYMFDGTFRCICESSVFHVSPDMNTILRKHIKEAKLPQCRQ